MGLKTTWGDFAGLSVSAGNAASIDYHERPPNKSGATVEQLDRRRESERIGVPGCSLSRMKRVTSWYLHILRLCVYHHDKTACALQVLLYCDVNTVEYDDPRHKFGQAPHLRIDAVTSTACTH